MARKIIKIIPGFASGDYPCIQCGKGLHLYYNGGECDSVECCGYLYETKIQEIDLVISKEKEIK